MWAPRRVVVSLSRRAMRAPGNLSRTSASTSVPTPKPPRRELPQAGQVGGTGRRKPQ